ncbi:hypothetical protein HELRODRAFT_164971 [Helobdella robusta]|uniref:Uncharacterized protein n=1 Tax=Helobdella robusta TaxID=6412 RepID=T1EW15_HELRO|nr:hypothetical protein HELRODRAFT_164971 [Helobdella robusta]ESN92840.1 hypothetical protein HELRODRAFT_164971 [Helobdella robusta]
MKISVRTASPDSNTMNTLKLKARSPAGLKWSRGAKNPGKYAIAEGSCRKIQNGPFMVLRLGTLNVGSLTGRSMEIVEMLERRRIDICCLPKLDGNRMVFVTSTQTKKNINYSGMVKRQPKMMLEFLSENR